MGIEKEPFRRYNINTPEHELKYGRPISVRLNDEERQSLEDAKKHLGTSRDSTALKELMAMGYNVLHTHLKGVKLGKSFKNKKAKKKHDQE